jgi:hypothetical protein
LFPERVEVRLAPEAVTAGSRTLACDPAFGAEPWQGALAALRGLEFRARCRVTVLLANDFVRYAVVPWSDALATEAEEEAYVRHHFSRIHGERAKSWALRWSDSLASAVDARLIEELRLAFPPQGKAKLVSVQPEFMAAFNRARGAIPAGGAWLVLADAERACVALHARGKWLSVQNARGAWQTLLERERQRAADANPERVLELAGGPNH